MNFKDLRRRCGFRTQEDLAKMLGVSRSTISMWELGLSRPNFKMITLISQVFNKNELDIIDCFKKTGS